ncbi:MAG: hypothetical protein U5N53_12465 [Mycobacterium sp.]|nr:hypothetical protein [Mycobacterium sp.]
MLRAADHEVPGIAELIVEKRRDLGRSPNCRAVPVTWAQLAGDPHRRNGKVMAAGHMMLLHIWENEVGHTEPPGQHFPAREEPPANCNKNECSGLTLYRRVRQDRELVVTRTRVKQ